ncbi:hypothetical protein BD410DRAFT_841991 [Rickenella mellea]|uniref:Uncharacterized protein n=1 Tax=Rickenella mellea TaxID=50990 RepID=A0A4Y7PX90_9AGAM|nr:hypothetical protein BD410DRAFT_841991 [Rickenella mellea]
MSATKHVTLSTTHSVFRSLQESLKENLTKLPVNAPPHLKNGLLAAHRKLSDYFNKFDDSPYYVWASLLDPRISYDGLKADYVNDDELSNHVDTCKASLKDHFHMYYVQPIENSLRVAVTDNSTASRFGSPQKFDFMARYKLR